MKRIGPWMQSYVDDRKLAGSSVLINQDGKEVYFNAVGLRDTEFDDHFDRDTVARIYSMTKPITSFVLMMLVEEGKVHLDAPLSQFIPEFAKCEALISDATSIDQTEKCACPTLHQLLTHTSGLSYPFNPGVLAAAMNEIDLLFKPNQGSLAQMCRDLAKLPLAFQPGSRWEYSVGIDVIGRVIEVITGQTLADVFAQRVFQPLKMTQTAFSVPVDATDKFAALYTPLAGNAMDLNSARTGEDSLRCVDSTDNSPFVAASMHSGGGGLVGTIDDYMIFCEMMRQGGSLNGERLLSPSNTTFMMRNHLASDIASMGPQSFAEQPMVGMGFGIGGAVVLDPARAGTPGSVGDFSWGGMASTFFWIDPIHNLSVVYFTQLTPSSSYPLRAQLKALVHGALQ
ncbi:MAG: CubicO group peptidase (beta-lactamase class C family) [Candidatus Azotimanducaceae bacterium]|jgi:CubicO group peptidase (beta-lactamase class C family)